MVVTKRGSNACEKFLLRLDHYDTFYYVHKCVGMPGKIANVNIFARDNNKLIISQQ